MEFDSGPLLQAAVGARGLDSGDGTGGRPGAKLSYYCYSDSSPSWAPGQCRNGKSHSSSYRALTPRCTGVRPLANGRVGAEL